MTEIQDESVERRQQQDEILIAALACGRSDSEAASLAGCSARTVRRRRENREFASEVSKRRADRAAAVTGRLLDLGDSATEALRAALEDESPRIRLRAAELVLGMGARLRRATDLDDEIAQLRSMVETYVTQQATDAQSDDRIGW